MNVKRILLNAFLLLVIAALLMLCVVSHAFDNWLNLIGIGVPMWVFIVLIVLIVNTYYQKKILDVLRSMQNPPSYDQEQEE